MNLGDWRSRIDDLDDQILNLLNQRAEAALQIGDLKRRQDLPSYVPEREAEIFKRLAASNPGPLTSETLRAIWTEVLSGCRALESATIIAYLGPPATFTHQAALQRFGAAAEYRPVGSIAEVFEEVERGAAHYGVVPVENTTEGAVNVTLDRLSESTVTVCGELALDIGQYLLSQARDLGEVKRVLSHPQGLAQCRQWLNVHLPDVPREDVPSTAGAAEIAAGDRSVGAIASELAGRLYGVPVLRARIEDNPHNSTRFLIIGTQRTRMTGQDKTSILFAMRNEAGALFGILEPLARLKINLTKIESRPAKSRPWEYVIFVDLQGHRDSPAVATALADMAGRTLFLRVLGSYPAA